MFSKPLKSVTLIELIIAIILLAVIILGVNNIGIFSRYQVVSSDRRAKLQNDVSRCLEHMTKYLSTAIGNEEVPLGEDTVVYFKENSPRTILSVFTDANSNGLIDSGGADYWIGYKFDDSTHKFTYCSQCQNRACVACSVTEDALANNITAFSASKSGTPANDFSKGNYINLGLTACWDPAGSCNTPDNPSVTMSTSISLPSVATN
ncbi:MAG: hypothetical protein Q7K98_03660 [Candidatus Omnitrophota bacterium]|nr:hypothetical protein [Candidatus Omnitrophota bacterium]